MFLSERHTTDQDHVDAVVLVTSELVTNATKYGAPEDDEPATRPVGDICLRLAFFARWTVVSVEDRVSTIGGHAYTQEVQRIGDNEEELRALTLSGFYAILPKKRRDNPDLTSKYLDARSIWAPIPTGTWILRRGDRSGAASFEAMAETDGDLPESGRGLTIVRSVAERFWWNRQRDSKTTNTVVVHTGVTLTDKEIARLDRMAKEEVPWYTTTISTDC